MRSEAAFPVVDPATDTIYAGNGDHPEILVINGAKCNAKKLAGCKPVTTIPFPHPQANLGSIDQATHTLYAADTYSDTVSAINIKHCSGRLIWPQCGRLIWPHFRPMAGRPSLLYRASKGVRGRDAIRSPRSPTVSDARRRRSRRTSTTRRGRRRGRSRRATRGCAAAAALTPSRANGKGDAYAYCKACHPRGRDTRPALLRPRSKHLAGRRRRPAPRAIRELAGRRPGPLTQTRSPLPIGLTWPGIPGMRAPARDS